MESKAKPFVFTDAPIPIPTLPVSSTTAAQSAHIASLTTQLHQLVDKNNAVTVKLELSQKEARQRLDAEIQRSDKIVRQMRDAHDEEMEAMKKRMERVSRHSIYVRQLELTLSIAPYIGGACPGINRICTSSNKA